MAIAFKMPSKPGGDYEIGFGRFRGDQARPYGPVDRHSSITIMNGTNPAGPGQNKF